MPSLEELLVSTDLISSPQLAHAQYESEQRRRSVAQTLIDLGILSDRQFAEWIANVTKLPLVDPLLGDVVHDVERYVARAVAREYEVVPIDVNADEMTVAMVNPLDKACMDVLQTTTGMKIHPVVALQGQLRSVIDRFYPATEPEHGAFDPSATVVAAPKPEPFQFGTETLLRSQSSPFVLGDQSIGSQTRVLPVEEPRLEPESAAAEAGAPSAEPSQLDRIEHHLVEMLRHIELLQRRIDAMDATLARILTRR
ncbi:MAG TPA: hypothetical protein VLU46_16990 [Thermoanaerobaculia bacterium]|nr:hypothetical protein [Thermoanaerobaculia bacterium]